MRTQIRMQYEDTGANEMKVSFLVPEELILKKPYMVADTNRMFGGMSSLLGLKYEPMRRPQDSADYVLALVLPPESRELICFLAKALPFVASSFGAEIGIFHTGLSGKVQHPLPLQERTA